MLVSFASLLVLTKCAVVSDVISLIRMDFHEASYELESKVLNGVLYRGIYKRTTFGVIKVYGSYNMS